VTLLDHRLSLRNEKRKWLTMLEDRTAEYRQRDLHSEGEWPPEPKQRYGSVIFNSAGEVLLREPLNHFGGYHWTFSKGQPDSGEHPVDTAVRETLEETGTRPVIIGHVPGVFRIGDTGTANCYYVMLDDSGLIDWDAVGRNGETNAVRWFSKKEAQRHISKSSLAGGRDRDLLTLDAAYVEFERLKAASVSAPEPL
jgi:8-oxo-dGTP pyrophosphatase MutT (NUDIX family)